MGSRGEQAPGCDEHHQVEEASNAAGFKDSAKLNIVPKDMVLVVRVEQSRSFLSCPGWVVARRDAATAFSIAGSSQSEEDEAGSQRVPALEPSAELARLKKYGGPLCLPARPCIGVAFRISRMRAHASIHLRARMHALVRACECSPSFIITSRTNLDSAKLTYRGS